MKSTRKDGFRSYWTVVRLVETAGSHLRRTLLHWQVGRTEAALYSLDDHVLRDIGITRAEIPAVARRVTAPAMREASTNIPASHSISAEEVVT